MHAAASDLACRLLVSGQGCRPLAPMRRCHPLVSTPDCRPPASELVSRLRVPMRDCLLVVPMPRPVSAPDCRLPASARDSVLAATVPCVTASLASFLPLTAAWNARLTCVANALATSSWKVGTPSVVCAPSAFLCLWAPVRSAAWNTRRWRQRPNAIFARTTRCVNAAHKFFPPTRRRGSKRPRPVFAATASRVSRKRFAPPRWPPLPFAAPIQARRAI